MWEPTRRERWTGSRALVPINLKLGCPACGYRLDWVTVESDALFVHGGYGATRRVVAAHCPACTWALVVLVDEVRPPR